MAIYRFKISFEDYEDVTREIEIKSDQTFADFHQAIQSAISFDGQKQSSFFMSNDNWIKGKEICTQHKTDKSGKKIAHVNNSKLSAYIVDPHQKIYYVVDGDAPWTFHIELVKILASADLKISYPHLIRKNGEAPRQYIVTVPPPGSGEDEFLELDDSQPEAEDDNVVEAVDESELGDDMSEEGGEASETEEGERDENFDDVEMSGDEDDR
jgi:hypothetical protein